MPLGSKMAPPWGTLAPIDLQWEKHKKNLLLRNHKAQSFHILFVAIFINPANHAPAQQAPDVCLTSDIGYILVATSYNQFPTSIRRHFLTSFGRLDWMLF